MRNKREHIRRAVVLMLAVAGLTICTAPFSTSSGLASAQAATPSWSYTGSLKTARLFHTTTLLANGKVLVAGGCNDAGCLSLDSAELYDPVTGTWGLTGGPNVDRVEHSATLLPNGKVLVAGGWNRGVVGSAELYDPVAGTWSFTGNLNVARANHTATLLPNGKVLVAGGTGTGIERDEQPWRSAELYDPATGTWSVTGNLNTGRSWHTQTLLPNGKVLVAGGTQNSEWSFYNLSSSELYDPNTGTWSLTGSLNVARFGLTATLLPNGNVLVTGGESQDGAINNSAELYNPTTETWSYTGSLSTARYGHTATLLPDGKVLVAGGHDWTRNTYLDSADVYDPATGNWSGTAKLNGTRGFHTAVLLQSGKVLVVGGGDANRRLLSAELYDSGGTSTSSPTPTPTSTPTATPTPIPSPPAPAANGKIAFTSDRDGNREIYMMNPDGTNQTRLTNNSIVDDHAMWSPDGKKLAFVSQREAGGFAIFQMNMDGTNRVEITPLSSFVNAPPWGAIGFSMSWSPDGMKIAFQDPNYDDIFVVDVETHTRQNLTNDGGAQHALLDFHPAWSPDGSTILYSSRRYNGVCPSLYAINPDGTNRRLLSGNHCPAYSPSWSPDGMKIVFVELNGEFAESELLIANSDGTNVRIFDGGYPDLNNRDYPRWSPDGRKIAFNMSNFQDIEIYVKSIDGTGYAQLTNTPAGQNYRPSWQPLLDTACPNPIDCNEFFVRQHYLDFLGREPDPASQGWQNILNNCPPSGKDANGNFCDEIEVSSAFFRSPEFQGRGYYIYRFYSSIGRIPVYEEFTPDFAKVSGFLSDQQLEANKAAFVNEFMSREEFQNKYSTTFNNPTAYVDALLQTVGLQNHPSRQSWINSLQGNNSAPTRAQVLRSLVESAEVYNKYYNEAFVIMQYFGFLRRTADAAYLDWIQTMNQTGGDYRVMINGFLNSTEYRRRFGP